MMLKEILGERPQQNRLAAAIRHEDRLSLHADMIVHKAELSPYYRDLIAWIGTDKPEILPGDKIERVKQLITTPIATVPLVDSIFSDLFRVFSGVDAFYRTSFDDSEIVADWDDYRDKMFWQVQGWAALRSAINSVWVAEVPSLQIGDYPDVKNKLINIRDVIHISHDKYSDDISYLAFATGGLLFEYNAYYINVYEYKDSKIGELIAEIPHDLGYVPARMFWSERMLQRDDINRRAPLTPVLGDLDWLLLHKTFKKYLDLANAYPITAAYKEHEDYTSNPDGHENTFMGPGTFWEVRAPLQGEADLMSNPVKLISPDVPTLDFHVQEEDRLEGVIRKRVVGVDSEATKMAQNEKQVLAGFESRTSILNRIAHNFEIIHRFADKTLFHLRYGEPADISIDYGTRFYLRNTEDLIDDLNHARIKNAHDGVIEMLSQEVIETKFRNNKSGYRRAMLIRALDPLPERSLKEAIDIFKEGGIDKINFIIKCNLTTFVMKFEREFMPLNVFVDDDDSKIVLIKDEFKKYAKEINSSEQRPGGTDQGE